MIKQYLSAVLLFLFLAASASQNRKVLVIGIDGCRSDALQQANTPYIDGLVANSLYSIDSWHTGITWSGPSWATILTGVQWNKHGITENSFNGSDFNNYPAFPKRAKEVHSNLYCVEVVEWAPLADNFYNDGWDRKVKVADGSNWPTADSAVIELQNPNIDVLFTYFDKVDLTGHVTTFSPSNPLYINAIQDVDSAIGKILNALYARPTYANEDWLILLITDHGGTGFSHGGHSYEERHIWWIASGSAVAHQQINQADPGTYDCLLVDTFVVACVNDSLLKSSPTHPDIAVTALHHLIVDAGVNPEDRNDWALDGKSWLLTPSSIGETEAEQLSVFPNPSNGKFTIEYDYTRIPDVELFDITGRSVGAVVEFDESISVQLQNPTNGIYFLKISEDNRPHVLRLFVGDF